MSATDDKDDIAILIAPQRTPPQRFVCELVQKRKSKIRNPKYAERVRS
jgi:hypothetical protein